MRDCVLPHDTSCHPAQSMECCRSWAGLYDVAAAASRKCAAGPWRFDRTAIFAHIDVFEQRCRCVEGRCHAPTSELRSCDDAPQTDADRTASSNAAAA